MGIIMAPYGDHVEDFMTVPLQPHVLGVAHADLTAPTTKSRGLGAYQALGPPKLPK